MHAALGLDSAPRELPRPRTWPDVEEGRGARSEQARRGKSVRSYVTRSSHGAWEPGMARSDPVSLLKDQTATWVPEPVPVRNRRMLSSPFAFHRGSVAIMAADLARTPTTGILVQLCGDAQLGNFGAYASGDQQLLFDMNDFDETLRGPWEWDVKRLMASLAILGRERGFDDGERATVVRSAAAAYREAMREFAALGALELWYSASPWLTSSSAGCDRPPRRYAGPSSARSRRR